MKKYLLTILFTFISFNVYAAEIKFSNNHEEDYYSSNNNKMCVSTMFYSVQAEICRPVSPWGKAIVKNTTIKNIYPEFKALMAEYHPLYEVLSDKLPTKDVTRTINLEKIQASYKAERISTKNGIEYLNGKVIYTIQPKVVNISIRVNDGVQGNIEFKQNGKDVIITKNTEYIDFVVENRKKDNAGFPRSFNYRLHDIHDKDNNIWVDYIYLSDIETEFGNVYKNVPIFFHKNPKKTIMENGSIHDLYRKLHNDEHELPNVGKRVENVGSKCENNQYNQNWYTWDDDGNGVGVIFTSCNSNKKYYYYYKQNGDNAECYLLALDGKH